MKRLLVSVLMVPMAALALSVPPKVHKGQEAEPSVGPRPNLPTDRAVNIAMIDSMTSYIRYLFEHQQGLVLPAGDTYYFFWAYNDNNSRVRTVIFEEEQFVDPASWITQDIVEWPGLRYVSPSAFWDGAIWYPEVTFNSYGPSATAYTIDEGGLGAGIWMNPCWPETEYDYYLPLTWAGTNNVVYVDGQARDVAADSHIFMAFDGWTCGLMDPPGEIMIFPADPTYGENPVYSQGYENSQLIAAPEPAGDRVVIATGGYRDADIGGHENPLLIVYRESHDGGLTWSDNTWVDQALVADLPGSLPGIEGPYSNQFFDLLIDYDGDLHFACTWVDSGYYGNTSEELGVWDIHQEDGVWTASMITDGVYEYDGQQWDPSILYTDGDHWMHSPTLSIHPDGLIFAAWNDLGHHNDADTTASLDIWTCVSIDGGNTWSTPWLMTDTGVEDEYFSRLTYNTTEENVYCVTMYGAGGVDGPLYCLQVPVDDYVIIGVNDSPRPQIATLSDPTPNPFREEVSLSLTLAKPAEVTANVYNIRGELVEVLASGRIEAGKHELVFDPRNHAPGVYFCRVQTENETMLKKLVFIQ